MMKFSAASRWPLLFVAAIALLAACSDDDNADTAANSDTTTATISTTATTGDTSTSMADASPTSGSGMHDMHGSPMADEEMDLMFIDGMIVHHQSAIDMSEVALEEAEHEEVRTLAEAIIAAQQAEIEQLNAWRDEWFPDAPASDMSSMEGMAGMNMSETDMQALRGADPFDQAFIDQMIPHHESAVMMARDIRETTERPELQQLAEEIITAQDAEIAQMREWREAWFGE
jgi:uncharacterized protein (DUF305 family)